MNSLPGSKRGVHFVLVEEERYHQEKRKIKADTEGIDALKRGTGFSLPITDTTYYLLLYTAFNKPWQTGETP